MDARRKLTIPFKVAEMFGGKANHYTRIFEPDD